MPAVEARERLAEFVAGVVWGLPHVRQRENVLLYVRGLIEQGGRKSLLPVACVTGRRGGMAQPERLELLDYLMGMYL